MQKFSKHKLVLVITGLIAATAITSCGKEEQQATMNKMAMPVNYAVIQTSNVPVKSELNGRIAATKIAEVRPQVSGVIQKRMFTEGAVVQKGDQLYQIDPSLYEAELSSAKASLAQAQATLYSAQLRYNRYAKLIKSQTISQQDYDDADATYRSAKANIKSAEALVKTAEINLAYTKVYAPITGTISRSNITEGALVTANQATAMATIQQLSPIYADLGQSVEDHREMQRNIATGTFNPNTDGQQVKIFFADGEKFEEPGELEFSESTVDESTGMVNVRVKIPNKNKILLPGMYIKGEINEGIKKDSILVPQISITRQTNGTSTVYLIDKNNIAQLKTVVLGDEYKNMYVVKAGISKGDKVITSNLQKIGPGSPVKPLDSNNAVNGTEVK